MVLCAGKVEPKQSGGFSGDVTTADNYHCHDRDTAWDAELFSHYLRDKRVPSVEQGIQGHLTLCLHHLFEGRRDVTVHCTGHWQLQEQVLDVESVDSLYSLLYFLLAF